MKCFFVMVLLSSSLLIHSYENHVSTISEIYFYGEEVNNDFKGGILFTMEKMPVGITHFKINNTDRALNALISVLLLGYSSDFDLSIQYRAEDINTTSGFCPVTMIKLPRK